MFQCSWCMLQNAGSLCSFGVQNAYWQTPLAGWGRKEGWIGRLLKAALCMQCIGEMCAHVTWPDTFNVYALHNYDNRKRLRTSTSSRKFVSRCALCGVCVFFFCAFASSSLFYICILNWENRLGGGLVQHTCMYHDECMCVDHHHRCTSCTANKLVNQCTAWILFTCAIVCI